MNAHRVAQRSSVRPGLERLISDPEALAALKGRRVKLLANPTAVTRHYEHAIDVLLRKGVELVGLFGPEHGLRAEAQDMEAVEEERDPISGLPLRSLYGHNVESLRPREDDFDGVDLLMVDIQDVGSRYYTYMYTALYCAEVAAAAGVSTLVLDRPNPLGGTIEGPPLKPGFESFVGELPLPHRHGLTLGEVLRFASSCGRDIDLTVLPASGWHRGLRADQVDMSWVMPSPNMPTPDTALVYPGQCLLEGTNLSEGRGTTRPFEIFGAPWVEPEALRAWLLGLELPGVHFRTLSFTPMFQKWAGQRCGGLQIHVHDRDVYQPVRTSLAILMGCSHLFPEHFAWRVQAYEFVAEIPAIDLLWGDDRLRTLLDARSADVDALFDLLRPDPACLRKVQAARLTDYDIPSS